VRDFTDVQKKRIETYWRKREDILQRGGREAWKQIWKEGWEMGFKESLIEGRWDLVSNLLEERFGTEAFNLYCIIDSLLELSNRELADVLLNLSARELLARFGNVVWREETLQEGRQEGRVEGRWQMVESCLKVRFGSLDEELSGAICADARRLANASLRQRQGRTQTQQRFAIALMLQLPPEELTRLLLNLSREELLERFGK
jgi:flagellar biosynthesis/type III secretory pathway protein FliH